MKKIVLGLGVAALALSTSAMAANEGWSAGLQAGWDKYTGSPVSGYSSTSGLAYGVNGVYNFTQNFGLQADLLQYSDLKVSGTNIKMKTYSLDIMAMGYWPLDDQFELFGGVGEAYVHTKAVGSDLDADNSSTTGHKYLPKATVGTSYTLDQNWSANVSYSRIFGNSSWATINTVMLGLNYSFN